MERRTLNRSAVGTMMLQGGGGKWWRQWYLQPGVCDRPTETLCRAWAKK